MRVRMLESVAGTRPDGSEYVHETGKEYDLDPQEARGYVERETAAPVGVTPSGRKGARGRGVETR